MSNLKGRFYFKRTSNGNLLGEFSNNQSGICTESADRVSVEEAENTITFIGDYYASWQENKKVSLFANLNISYKKGFSNQIYTLMWKRDNVIIFEGEGMLCDDILIGNYWDLI
ncbi:MAG: hypothetical protein WCH34_18155 [Bacteroidota bacterium]